jgi:mRNA-degrading endonuclease RelE of RelBE toxin-antitoxin system
MDFEVMGTGFFYGQIETLDEKSRRVIKDKIRLIKKNPFRYKRVHSKRFSRVHRVRVTVENRSTRLVYAIVGSRIFLACLLDRGKDYRDLDRYLKEIEGCL